MVNCMEKQLIVVWTLMIMKAVVDMNWSVKCPQESPLAIIFSIQVIPNQQSYFVVKGPERPNILLGSSLATFKIKYKPKNGYTPTLKIVSMWIFESLVPKMSTLVVCAQDSEAADLCPHGTRQFLSPPVCMHDGLICIVFCLSVCLSVTGPKFTLDKKLLDKKSFWAIQHAIAMKHKM